ncbi:MAG: hypothetical protein GQ525_10550 [Draconibacterium sp.]|nr:hypothetical protein [Draconibacterium sp.]
MLDTEKYFDSDKLVDEVLNTDLQFSLPDNFADVLAEKISRKYVWQQYIQEFLIYLGVFAGMAVATGAMAFIWFGADWKVWLDFIVANAGLVAGLNILSVFVLFADRVLLRYFMFKSSREVV